MARIGIIGSAGRMGAALAEAIAAAGDVVSGGVDKGDDLAALAAASDVLVDFSAPAALEGNLDAAIAAGVPIVPVCVSSYVKHMRLNRWRSGKILIRSLPAIPTAGLSLDDMPLLIAQCREQMRDCIASMDRQLQAA